MSTTHTRWHVLTLVVPAEQAEAVADDLRLTHDWNPVQLDRPGSPHAWLEIYFDHEAEARASEQSVCETCPCLLKTAIRQCDSRDWHTFWQLHFQPRAVGERLFLQPAWDEATKAPVSRQVIRIVPGLSFGTGEHFTTRFCLETIDRLAPPHTACRSLWDVGCGSGVLGVAAARLGFDHVLGTDNDPICLIQAADNAALNGVTRQTEWAEADILNTPLPNRMYDVVCANLFAGLLCQAAPVLWQQSRHFLVLSGIRESEIDAVADTFSALNAREIVRDGDGDWVGVCFAR